MASPIGSETQMPERCHQAEEEKQKRCDVNCGGSGQRTPRLNEVGTPDNLCPDLLSCSHLFHLLGNHIFAIAGTACRLRALYIENIASVLSLPVPVPSMSWREG